MSDKVDLRAVSLDICCLDKLYICLLMTLVSLCVRCNKSGDSPCLALIMTRAVLSKQQGYLMNS